jgi:hypothetical protein
MGVMMPDPMARNVFPVRLQPRPDRRQQKIHANAEARFRARRTTELTAGHELIGMMTRLSLIGSARRSELADVDPFASVV